MNKAQIGKKYEHMCNEDHHLQECVSCGEQAFYLQMERHHPAGRHGMNLLKYVYLCKQCHRDVHDYPKVATKRGLLWPARNTRDIEDQEWSDLLHLMKQNQFHL